MDLNFLDQEYKTNDIKFQKVKKRVQELDRLLKISKEEAKRIKNPRYAVEKGKEIF